MDGVRFIHRTLRGMMNGVEQASANMDYSNEQQVGALTGQFQGLNFVLGTHIHDEDILIFPLIEKHAPDLVPNYHADHEHDREVLNRLNTLIGGLATQSPAERAVAAEQIQRDAVALHATSELHMQKEEQILYPRLNKHTSDEEQWKVLGVLYGKLPTQMFPMAAPGMMKVLNQDEREEQLRAFLKVMPAANLKVFVEHAPKGMTPAEWQELNRRMPALAKL